jgi:hypothetical protein
VSTPSFRRTVFRLDCEPFVQQSPGFAIEHALEIAPGALPFRGQPLSLGVIDITRTAWRSWGSAEARTRRTGSPSRF